MSQDIALTDMTTTEVHFEDRESEDRQSENTEPDNRESEMRESEEREPENRESVRREPEDKETEKREREDQKADNMVPQNAVCEYDKKPVDREASPSVDDKAHQPIKFRSCHPLGELHLRIAANIFIILSQVGVIVALIGLVGYVISEVYKHNTWGEKVYDVGELLYQFQFIPLALVLIADFAPILRERQSYAPILIKYGGISVGFFLLYIFVYFRYGVAFMMLVPDMTYSRATSLIDEYAGKLFQVLVGLNVFIDLFICALISYFINYTPTKHFQGKRLYLFRAFAAIPILYSVFSMVFRALNGTQLVIRAYLWALLPLKPPMFLAVFLLLVYFLKREERLFTANGGTLDDYNRYVLSPDAVHKFSRFTSLVLMICSIIDFSYLVYLKDSFSEETNQMLLQMQMGGGAFMFLAIPFILLFDYTKPMPKFPFLNLILKIVTIVICVILYIEAIYWSLYLIKKHT